jgi:hypothetical protein
MAAILAAAAAVIALAVFMVTAQTPRTVPAPVIVELFTSQGCSSCPPADALLRRIAEDPKLRGKVIPLAYHVDYWNRLGWRDPFSSREWSQRQGDYVRAMKLGSAYTPQIVVNGTRQMVGSSAADVNRAIAEESRRKPAARVRLTRTGATVRVQADRAPNAELVVVLFEPAASTKVPRGENSGRTLVNPNVVRKLIGLSGLDGSVEVPSGMSVAAFLQDRTTKRILGAAS